MATIAHHEEPESAARWFDQHSRIAIGWGRIGSLLNFHAADDIAASIRTHYADYPTPMKGGRCLYDFCRVLAIGDLVIVAAKGTRVAVYEVLGDYEFTPTSAPPEMQEYPHQRGVSRLMTDPNALWRKAGGRPVKGYNRFFPLHPLPAKVPALRD